MKHKAIIAAIVLCLSSCAETVFYRDGTPIARFQGDMRGSEFTIAADGALTWKVLGVDHSTATAAQGKSASDKFTAAGAAFAVSGILKLFH